jgi:hypothetical protein
MNNTTMPETTQMVKTTNSNELSTLELAQALMQQLTISPTIGTD